MAMTCNLMVATGFFITSHFLVSCKEIPNVTEDKFDE